MKGSNNLSYVIDHSSVFTYIIKVLYKRVSKSFSKISLEYEATFALDFINIRLRAKIFLIDSRKKKIKKKDLICESLEENLSVSLLYFHLLIVLG
jgi:hypothetical protein